MTIRRSLITLLLLLLCVAPLLAIVSTRVTVATTATLLFTAPASGVCPASPACRVLVRNPSSVSVYVGPSTVTTANGFEIAAGDSFGVNLTSGDTLYGVVAAATQVVHVVNPQ